MFDNGIFGWFKSSKEERAPERKWDPKTVTMEQPTSPPAPSTERVVTEQPVCPYPCYSLDKVDRKSAQEHNRR